MAKIILKDVRLAFPQIWTAKPFEPGAKPRFNASFLFPQTHPAFNLTMAAITEVAKEGWGEQWQAQLAAIKGNSNKMCFIDGNLKSNNDGYAGNYVISAGNTARPAIVDRDGKTPLVEADGRPYGGCYVTAILDVWCQTKKYPGIRCSLLGVQFVRDGDAFSGGGVASEDDFEDLSDGADAPDVGATVAAGGFV